MTGTGGGRLAGRIALVTGASRGIGRAVALRFAREGAHIVAVARTQGALEELDDEIRKRGAPEPATLVPADVTDFDVLDRMGAAIFERWGRLDILVGNAATLGTLGPLTHTEPRAFERVLALNLTANWRLLRSFDPLLRSSDAGRAMFVTAGVGRDPTAYWGAYALSKAALEHMVRIYAAETVKTRVKANLINPGPTRTALRAAAFPGENPASIKSPEAVTDLFVDLAAPDLEVSGHLFAVEE